MGGCPHILISMRVYLRVRPLDRLSGCCFACESGQRRNGIIRLGVQSSGAGLDEDWGSRQVHCID